MLHNAVQYGLIDVAKLLVKAPADQFNTRLDVNMRHFRKGQTVLHVVFLAMSYYAPATQDEEFVSFCELLLSSSSEVTKQT